MKLTGRGLFFYNNSEKLLSQILVYFFVFFLPVITDGSGQFLGGNGNPYIYKIHVLILCHELCLEFAVYQFVKIALNRGLIAQFQLMVFEIVDNVPFNGIADPVFKKCRVFRPSSVIWSWVRLRRVRDSARPVSVNSEMAVWRVRKLVYSFSRINSLIWAVVRGKVTLSNI